MKARTSAGGLVGRPFPPALAWPGSRVFIHSPSPNLARVQRVGLSSVGGGHVAPLLGPQPGRPRVFASRRDNTASWTLSKVATIPIESAFDGTSDGKDAELDDAMP